MSDNALSFLPVPSDVSLTEIPLFSGFDKSEYNTVSKLLKLAYLKKDVVIFKEGDKGENMFILLSGSLSAFGTQSESKVVI